MWSWLPAGASRWPIGVTVLAWGGIELALRLRLAIRLRRRAPTQPDAAGSARPARPGRAGRASRWRDWTLYVIIISISAAVLSALWIARQPRFGIGGGRAVIVAGESLALAGLALRVWAILTLDRLFTFFVGVADDHRVVTAGPYRLLRHPGYAGVLLTLLGVGIALANWLSLLIMVVVPAVALGIRITVEESVLRGALGAEYLAYADRTARLIPGIW